MKGTDKQKQMLRDLGITDWTEKELAEAAAGYMIEDFKGRLTVGYENNLEECQASKLHRESESEPLPDAGKASP